MPKSNQPIATIIAGALIALAIAHLAQRLNRTGAIEWCLPEGTAGALCQMTINLPQK